MAKHVNWADRKSDIERMVADGMTDAEIGLVYDRDGRVIYQVRRRFGILSNVKRISRSLRQVFAAQDPAPPPLTGETYIDEAGLTVTRYPARYAAGALIQTVTAKPRR